MKLLMINIKKELFPTDFLDHCNKKGNEPQNIPSEIKNASKKGFGTRVVCTSGYDTHR